MYLAVKRKELLDFPQYPVSVFESFFHTRSQVESQVIHGFGLTISASLDCSSLLFDCFPLVPLLTAHFEKPHVMPDFTI